MISNNFQERKRQLVRLIFRSIRAINLPKRVLRNAFTIACGFFA